MTLRLYRGEIAHARTQPLAHAFRDPAAFIAVQLSTLEALRERRGPLGYNRRAALWLDDRDYLEPDARPIRTKLEAHMPGLDHGRTILLTTPRSWLPAFNPMSGYFAFGEDGRLAAFGAEVTNTYGERRLYVLEPSGSPAGGFTATAPKDLYVSPFNGVKGEYRFRGVLSDERAALSVELVVDGLPVVSASLFGEGQDLAGSSALDRAQVALAGALARPRIYLHALRLRSKGLRAVMKPRPPATALRLRTPRP